MTPRNFTSFVLLTVLVLGSLSKLSEAREAHRPGNVVAMTRNLYVGADILRILETDPSQIPIAVSQTLQTVRRNRPAERMEAVAQEIWRTRPHVVGLQEAFQILTQTPGDFLQGNPTPAQDIEVDYLDLLLGALERKGLRYRVVSTFYGTDVELPGLGFDAMGTPFFFDARVVDRDVILARADVETANPLAFPYTFNAPIEIPGGEDEESLRGVTAVDAWVHGRRYCVANTHLEVDLPGPAIALQAAQAQELLGFLSLQSCPLIVLGDFNSWPEQPEVPGIVSPYQQFLQAGYVDAWKSSRRRTRGEGHTCCQAELLNDPESSLDRRIDFIWVRPAGTQRPGVVPFVPIQAVVLGDELRDRTPSGYWPSDHAGIVARIHMWATEKPQRRSSLGRGHDPGL